LPAIIRRVYWPGTEEIFMTYRRNAMKRIGFPFPFALILVLSLCLVPLLPSLATAESPEHSGGQASPPPITPGSEKEPADMLGNMMGSMMEANMKAYISFLGKPEVAEKLAAFTKNYYDALVAKGFTKEEALRIVTAASPVNVPGQK
jgi:hypothetical protein